jgi:hypothetical protein
MKFTREELKERFKNTVTSKDWYDLYEEYYGTAVPFLGLRNPNDTIDKIINSLISNKKLKEVKIPKGMEDFWE